MTDDDFVVELTKDKELYFTLLVTLDMNLEAVSAVTSVINQLSQYGAVVTSSGPGVIAPWASIEGKVHACDQTLSLLIELGRLCRTEATLLGFNADRAYEPATGLALDIPEGW